MNSLGLLAMPFATAYLGSPEPLAALGPHRPGFPPAKGLQMRLDLGKDLLALLLPLSLMACGYIVSVV